ncbi:MAG: DNA-methyltransferase [Methylocystaceae bacterium]
MELNRIICGDTITEMKKIPDSCIDLIFADPPYWMRVDGVLHRVEGREYDGCDDAWDNQFKGLDDYEDFTRQWLSQCQRILKKDGSIWVIGSMQCIYTIGAVMQRLGYWFINDIIWHKKNPTPNFKGTRLNNSHETLIWATKNVRAKYTFNYKTGKELNRDTVDSHDFNNGVRKQLGSVWRIPVCQGYERLKDTNGNKLHSTQKPEELLYRVIAISSQPGDIILDPFGGTMTTAAVARKMGRQYLAIDNNEIYCQFGRKRVELINPEIGSIETALFDLKPPRVTMEEMINAQYFFPGEKFYLRNSGITVELTASGKVLHNGQVTDMHSAAASARGTQSRINGFDYWQVVREGQLVSIKEIRTRYINGMIQGR